MFTSQSVCCPTCGSSAQRYRSSEIIRTECLACDYLLELCALTGKVRESYAPGLSVERFQRAIQPRKEVERRSVVTQTEASSKALAMAVRTSSG